MDSSPTIDDIYHSTLQNRNLLFSYWHHHNLFTWQWWLLLFIMIVPWVLWLRWLDRSRKYSICALGLILMQVINCIDTLGTYNGLWLYNHNLLPVVPALYPYDYSLLPVTYMLLYQLYRTWKSFTLAMFITSFLLSFVLEPLSIWMGFYVTYHWKHMYSLPIYMIQGMAAKALIDRVFRIR